MVSTRSMTAAAAGPEQQIGVNDDIDLRAKGHAARASERKRRLSRSSDKGATKKAKSHPNSVAKDASRKAKSSTKEAANSSSETTFFSLPPEIRNDIYGLVLQSGQRIKVNPVRPFLQAPGLIFTCRQIWNESSPFFYAVTTFEVRGTVPCNKFLRSLLKSAIPQLRNIHMNTSETSKIDPSSLPWLRHVRNRLEGINREFGQRGLDSNAVQYPLVVNGEWVWLGEDHLNDVSRDAKGVLTMTAAGEERLLASRKIEVLSPKMVHFLLVKEEEEQDE